MRIQATGREILTHILTVEGCCGSGEMDLRLRLGIHPL